MGVRLFRQVRGGARTVTQEIRYPQFRRHPDALCNPRPAKHLLEKLRARLENAPVRWEQITIAVTVSIGFVGTALGLPVEILGQADQALYYAKEHGRNQVCFYDDLIASGDLVTQVAHDDVELF